MSTPMRTRRSASSTGARFGRTAARRTPRRRMVAGGRLQRRRPARQSTVQRIMGRRRGKAGGMALLAGAAGMLFKNRGKLTSRMRRDGGT